MQLYKPGIAFPNIGNPWPIMEEASEDGEYYYKEDVHAEIERLRTALEKIRQVRYGLEQNATDEECAKYWSDIAVAYRQVAAEALRSSEPQSEAQNVK